MMTNIPVVKPGIIAVSRDCFPVSLSASRRAAIVRAFGEGLYECPVTVENERDALAALADVKAAGCTIKASMGAAKRQMRAAVRELLKSVNRKTAKIALSD